jgi:hypothetical protein
MRSSKLLKLSFSIAQLCIYLRAFAGTVGRVDLNSLRDPIYTTDGDAFVRHNGDRFSNRPLYCNHISAVALGGDKPFAMFGTGPLAAGSHMIAFVRAGKAKWLFNASDITSKYRPDRMEWIINDPTWATTSINLQLVPLASGAGMALRLRATAAQPGDQLIWASGCSAHLSQSFLYHYDMTTLGRDNLLKRGFVPDDCSGDDVQIDGNRWTISPPDGKGSIDTLGTCSVDSSLSVADATQWKDPLRFAASKPSDTPCICGTLKLDQHPEVFWTLRTKTKDGETQLNPSEDFNAGLTRALQIQQQVVVDTPDPWLNAAVGASDAVIDGVYRDGMYTHSGMRWSVPLLGWRTTFGATAYGWHDNVKAQAKRCVARQITDSDKTTPQANPAALLASQGPQSMMFGKGRVNLFQPAHYDMQSQFFDQLISAWNYTADPELETILRPALNLHLDYIKNCFDPAGLGIYESYANTWPTDDQWYNGGGTSEETAYAYHAETTALEMARRAGDQQQSAYHQAAIDRIRKGFFSLLWNPATGHPGAYREQGGLHRLHDSCWLYSIFCPIDAGLLTTEQAAQSLYYTESQLERIQLPYGGEQCWPSNWVPSIWSLREMWPGDNYHLALAYFKTGLPDQAYSLLHGTFAQMMFFGPVPADLGHPAGGTDFNDCASMFCRTVVEGLFGYQPDYPNKKVTIAPQFPSSWNNASIKTPDVEIRYTHQGTSSSCSITLTAAADLKLSLPVSTTAITSVTADGAPVKYEITPGFGQSIVTINLASIQSCKVQVSCADLLQITPQPPLNVSVNDPITFKPAHGQIIDFHDPQNLLINPKIDNGSLTASLSKNTGNHLLFALARTGQTQQWQMFKLNISDPAAAALESQALVTDLPPKPRWASIDLTPELNADVRQIFRQKYLSPRPNTCSLRLATDGYSTWQMILDPKNKIPDIDFSNIPSLQDSTGHILTRRGVPFSAPADKKNIAFTSQWDNYPRQLEFPVNQSAGAIWLLLCGSTNPMECSIANAQLRLNYTDGTIETIDLIPPQNFWSLCPFGRADYDYTRDGFCLPKIPPETLQLGNNCRAIVLNRKLLPGKTLKTLTLQTLSQQVVIGLMGITLMNPANP